MESPLINYLHSNEQRIVELGNTLFILFRWDREVVGGRVGEGKEIETSSVLLHTSDVFFLL